MVPLELAPCLSYDAAMAEHYEPPDPYYREWATGAVRLELHAITGAWQEFQDELAASPELAAEVLAWICPEDDWEYAAVQEAQRIAGSILNRELGTKLESE